MNSNNRAPRQHKAPDSARDHSVGDFTSVSYWSPVSLHVLAGSQQHRLLQGERLLCVPVVWSSEQLGELLLLLLELCPVLEAGCLGWREM